MWNFFLKNNLHRRLVEQKISWCFISDSIISFDVFFNVWVWRRPDLSQQTSTSVLGFCDLTKPPGIQKQGQVVYEYGDSAIDPQDLNQVSKIISTPNEAFARPYANGIFVTSQLPSETWTWISQRRWVDWLIWETYGRHQNTNFFCSQTRLGMKLSTRNLLGLFFVQSYSIYHSKNQFLWWPSTKQMRQEQLHEGFWW